MVNPAVMAMLSDDLKAKATELANGGTTTVGDIAIEAVPAYNTTEERLQYHPKGRDNGYVLTIDGRRVYIAGDTEDIPEMRALTDIYIAFVPMNLPYTMDETRRPRPSPSSSRPTPIPTTTRAPTRSLRREGFRRHRGGDGAVVRRGLRVSTKPFPLWGGWLAKRAGWG